ncbi:MAG TPA: hypothetical protein VKK79_25220 [Candidatus Lokiarchaeia archaeon]|nr:hypothetical protein [Candidatus Lokiarchaeia archaeon]
MVFESIYMVRGGAFGEDFDIQFFLSVAAFAVCLVDWRIKHRKDYFWVFLTGSIVWTLAELVIQLTGVRVMGTKYLFGFPIPLAVSVVLQGIAEGAAIAILGICIGDLLMAKSSRKAGIIAFVIILASVAILSLAEFRPAPDVGGDVPSRRDMFAIGPLLFVCAFSTIGVVWLWWTDRAARARGLWMLLVMIIFASVWTLFEFSANTRWIEVGTLGNLALAPPAIEFGAFAWDVVVEIGLMYVPFLAIPHALKLMNPKEVREKQV